MGASDFNTNIVFKKIDKNQVQEVIKFIEYYAVERYNQYKEQRNCWYFMGYDHFVDEKGF